MWKHLDPPNVLTLSAPVLALMSVVLASDGRVAWSMVALILCGLVDLFDGPVAGRFMDSTDNRRIGARLDSLSDVCCFGFAPAIVLHLCGMRSLAETAILAVFLCSTILRVAYYDTVGLTREDQRRCYFGLPSTYVALFVPLAFIVAPWMGTWYRWWLSAVVVALAAAMTSRRPIPKPGGVAYALFAASAVVAIAVLIGLRDLLSTFSRS